MGKKIVVSLVATFVLASIQLAEAQQPKKIPRIGFLSGSGGPAMVEAFRQGLRDLGYIEQRNILVELRYVEGQADRIPSLVAELVQLKVDVLVSGTFPAIRAAKQRPETEAAHSMDLPQARSLLSAMLGPERSKSQGRLRGRF